MIIIGVTLIHEKLLLANIISKPYIECWQVSTDHGHPVQIVDSFLLCLQSGEFTEMVNKAYGLKGSWQMVQSN